MMIGGYNVEKFPPEGADQVASTHLNINYEKERIVGFANFFSLHQKQSNGEDSSDFKPHIDIA